MPRHVSASAAAALAACLALASAGCASPDKAMLPSITEADQGHTITLSVGQPLDIKLAGNPTTGYQWELSKTDVALLPLVSSSYVRDTSPAAMVGVGGHYLFRFKAAAPGEVPLSLTYRRPWLKEKEEGEKVFTVDVRIKP